MIVALLVLGGFSHDVWGLIVDHDHGIGQIEHAGETPMTDGDQDAEHHAICHSHALAIVTFDQQGHLMVVVGIEFLGAVVWVPDAVPPGIDVPPQRA